MNDKFEDRLIEYDKKVKELKQELYRNIAITVVGFLIAAGSLFLTTGIIQEFLIFIGIFLMIMPVVNKLTEEKKHG